MDDTNFGTGAAYVTLGTVATLVIGAIAKAIIDYRKTSHDHNRDLIAQYASAYDESRKEVHSLRSELHEATMRLSVCQSDLARAVERIGALEELIERHTDIKFRRWTPNDSSASFDVQP